MSKKANIIIIVLSVLFIVWAVWYFLIRETDLEKVARAIAQKNCAILKAITGKLKSVYTDEYFNTLTDDQLEKSINSINNMYIKHGQQSLGNPATMDRNTRINIIKKFLFDMEELSKTC